jgi:hypothetical protein
VSIDTSRRSCSSILAVTLATPACTCVASVLPLRPRSSSLASGTDTLGSAASNCSIISSTRASSAGDRPSACAVACHTARCLASSAASSDFAFRLRASSARVCAMARS